MSAPNHRSIRGQMLAYAPAWLTLIVGALVTLGAARWFSNEARSTDAARFDSAITNLIERLDTRSERYVEQLERFADWIALNPDVRPVQWEEYVKRLAPAGNLPALVELAYATNSALRSRQEIDAEIPTRRRDPYGKPVLESIPTPPRLRISRQWRAAPNAAPNYTETWLNNPSVSDSWWRTINGRNASSPPRTVPGETNQPIPTVSIFTPIFTRDFVELLEKISGNHLAMNRFQGLVVGSLDWRTLTSDLAAASPAVRFDAYAGAAEEPALAGVTMNAAARASQLNARFWRVVPWPFYREQWQLVFYSTPQFDRQSTRYRAMVALAGGATVTLLMAVLLGFQVRARRAQEAIAADLRIALDELGAARQERERLDHDLHDGTIQSLYALQLGLSRTVAMSANAESGLNPRLEDHRRSVTAVIGELRGFILKHEAQGGPTGHLAGVLESIAARHRISTGQKLLTDLSENAARRLNAEQAVHLANLAREAISNALRHAEAGSISISLRENSGLVELVVADDGIGFDPAATNGEGLGLKSMASRAHLAGGAFHLASSPGCGCRVRVVIPAPDSSPSPI